MATATATPKASRKATAKQRTFKLSITIESTAYRLVPLRPHPEVAARVWRFGKLGATGTVAAQYDLPATATGHSCEGLGYLRHGTVCKHIRVVRKLGELF